MGTPPLSAHPLESREITGDCDEGKLFVLCIVEIKFETEFQQQLRYQTEFGNERRV